MRKSAALLCFSLIFSAAWAAAPVPPSPTDTYIVARDRYIAELKSNPSDETLERKALADLERLLVDAVGPWRPPANFSKGRVSLPTLYDSDLGFGALDGLIFETKGTEVVVSTTALFRHWLADHHRWWEGRDDLPQSPEAAIHSEALYTFAIDGDLGEAAAYSHGEVPVALQGRTGAVLLMAFAQDLVLDRGPTAIAAAVVRGDQVFVAQQELTARIVRPAVCRRQLKLALARLETSKVQGSEEKADRAYRACFAAHLREQPHYKEILRQAQSLADLLH